MIFHLISRISHFDDPSPFLFGRQKRTETKSTGDEDDNSVDASMSGDSNENSFPAANPPRAIVPVLVEVAAQTRHPRCLRILERIFKNELCFKQIIDMDLPVLVVTSLDPFWFRQSTLSPSISDSGAKIALRLLDGLSMVAKTSYGLGTLKSLIDSRLKRGLRRSAFMAALAMFAGSSKASDYPNQNLEVELSKTFAWLELEEQIDDAGGVSDGDWRFSCLSQLHRYYSLRLQFVWRELKDAMESHYPNLDTPASLAVDACRNQGCEDEMQNADRDYVIVSFATSSSSLRPSPSSASTMRLLRSSFARISPAFSAMISGNTFIEGKAGQVHFPNMSASDFALFLRLIDSAGKLSETADTLATATTTSTTTTADSSKLYFKESSSENDKTIGSSAGKSSSKSPWLDRVIARDSRYTDDDEDDSNFYETVTLALQSSLSVLQFSHQYLVAVDERRDGLDSDSRISSKGNNNLLNLTVLLMAKLVVENGRYVQISTMLNIVSSLHMMMGEKDIVSDSREGKGKKSGCGQDLDSSICRCLSETKTLIDICKTTLKAVL